MALLRRREIIQQDERRRIARDVHDHLGQQMTALRMQLELLQGLCGSQQAVLAQVTKAQRLAEGLDRGLDDLIAQLHTVPAAQADFAGALSTLLAEWSERFGIPVQCAVASGVAELLPRNMAATLVAITEEALHNVIKHARATSVKVSLSCGDDRAVLMIEDDGRGFNLRQDVGSDSGIGLVTMRERAELARGELVVESSLNGGTSISVRVPLAAKLEPDWREPA